MNARPESDPSPNPFAAPPEQPDGPRRPPTRDERTPAAAGAGEPSTGPYPAWNGPKPGEEPPTGWGEPHPAYRKAGVEGYDWWSPDGETLAVDPPPAGATYDQLARTARNRWWRPVAGTLLIAVVWAALQLVLSLVVFVITKLSGRPVPGNGALFSDPVLDTGTQLVVLAFFIPLTMLAARVAQRRPAGSVVSVVRGLRMRWLGVCFGLALLPVLLSYSSIMLIDAFGSGPPDKPGGQAGWVGFSAFVVPALMVLVLVPFQAAGEEFVFRGWIIQFFGAYLRRPYVGMAVQAVLFAMAHGLGTMWGFLDLLLFAMIAGYLTVRTGGLEAGIALHTLNNLAAFLIATGTGQLGDTQTAAQAPWQFFLVDMVVLTGFAALVPLVAQKMNVSSHT